MRAEAPRTAGPFPALLLAGLAAASSLPTPARAGAFDVQPAPAWVEPLAPDLARPAPAETSGGVDYLVVDDQVRVSPESFERYRHIARRMVSAKGVADGSELRIDFDPQYERLVLHEVSLRRGGARIRALHPDEVRVIQREPDLDRRLYDGEHTALIFLRDVRVGDVVEASWTIRGANPVFGGRYADSFWLGYNVPVARLGVRLLLPGDRPLRWRVQGLELPPSRSRRDGTEEYRWTRADVAATQDEGDLPPGLEPLPWVEVSEWQDWGEVVRWALPLYAPTAPSAAMAARLKEWRALPDEGTRALAALRFVQDEVRYLGIELGTSSHQPHRPADVFAWRFGDCKDKSLLLVTLLRGLGIDAAPALANTEDQDATADRLPSPFAFDHVIVRARVGGAERWLEPTRSLEHARLDALSPPAYGRALVLAPGELALASLPAPATLRTDVRSTWRIPRFGAAVGFEVVTRLEGLKAIEMRHMLAETPAAELQRRYLDHYARTDPGIRSAGPLQVDDDPAADRITLTERYELPAIAEGDERQARADAIREELSDPATALRKLPLRLRHPVRVTEQLRVELPGKPEVEEEERDVRSAGARLAYAARTDGTSVVFDLEFQSLAGVLQPGAVPRHLAALREMRQLWVASVPLRVKGSPSDPYPSRGDGAHVAQLLLLLVGVGVAAFLANGNLRAWWIEHRQRRRRRSFASRLVHRRGEAPHSPIPVRTADEAAARSSALRCGCGAPLAPPSGGGERLLFGGRELIVFALACERCGQGRRAYFGLEP
jgi:hypothetical protein